MKLGVAMSIWHGASELFAGDEDTNRNTKFRISADISEITNDEIWNHSHTFSINHYS